MVKQLRKNGEIIYVCEACGFAYAQKEWAEKCQKWCEENQSCNIEITAHALDLGSESGAK